MIRLIVSDRNNKLIAEAVHADSAMMCVDRFWEEGDRVEIAADRKSVV